MQYIHLIIGVSYAYFWLWLIVSFINKGWFYKKETKEVENIINLMFQFTTRGGNPEIVNRGIENILASELDSYVIFVFTEDENDLKHITKDKKVIVVLVPENYKTKNNTKLKARSLHYATEYYKEYKLNSYNNYIIHYDEESVITPDNLRNLQNELNIAYKNKIDLTCGCIYYPLEYKEAGLFSRAMESNRAFIEPECAIGCLSSIPKQGHGSNMVVRASIECEAGWDIGLAKGQAIISEDIFFLIKLKSFGANFGWHGVPMIEQPAFTLDQSLKQRYRWVFGSLQSAGEVHKLDGWHSLNWWERFNLREVIVLRCFSYGLGFIIGLISLLINIYLALNLIIGNTFDFNFSIISTLTLFMWLGAYQYGVYMNLKHGDFSLLYKIKEHIIISILSPFIGLAETYPAFRALIDWWIFQKRKVEWKPTIKKKN